MSREIYIYIFKSPFFILVDLIPVGSDGKESAVRETRVLSLDQENALEKGMAAQSTILAWRSHGQRCPVSHSPWDHKEADTTKHLTPHFTFSYLNKSEMRMFWNCS